MNSDTIHCTTRYRLLAWQVGPENAWIWYSYIFVTELPKIIPYYCLSLSMWPLSNNKELLCRFYRVKPDESLTTGSRYALSPHEGGTRVQHYITIYKRFTSSTLLQSRFSYIKVTHGSQFRQRKVNYTHDTHRRPSMHITPHHCSPIQVPRHMG
jgi:hypothetical protein